MEFLDYLKNAARSSTSIYIKFLQQYNFESQDIHVFIEGKNDPSFYSNYVEKYKKKSQKIFYYTANSKKGVYHNYSQVDWNRYEKNRVLFFVDKDFRDILNENYPIDRNIFETKFYSIENYIVTQPIFARCLRELLSLDDDKLVDVIAKEFVVQLNNFHREIMPVIALILYFRENNLIANLNQIDLNKVFDFKTKVKRKKSIKQVLESSMDTPNAAPWKDVLRHIRSLNKIKNPKYFVRGKFELWFFVNFLNSLPEALNRDRKKGDPKIRLCVNLSESNAVQILAPRLRIPRDVKSFLDDNLKKSA